MAGGAKATTVATGSPSVQMLILIPSRSRIASTATTFTKSYRAGDSHVLRPRRQRDSAEMDRQNPPRHGDARTPVQYVADGAGLHQRLLSGSLIFDLFGRCQP